MIGTIIEKAMHDIRTVVTRIGTMIRMNPTGLLILVRVIFNRMMTLDIRM